LSSTRCRPNRAASTSNGANRRTDRHRLHRGGDRLANNALWRVALVGMHCHQPTKDYVARRIGEGQTRTEILRCLIGGVSGLRPGSRPGRGSSVASGDGLVAAPL
jgi:hypothetical protein